MEDVYVEVAGTRVTIDFASLCLNTETLTERVSEILPLLKALIYADDAWLNLSGVELATRERACIAMDMMCQEATQSATNRAKLLEAVANGSESIANHGFRDLDFGQDLSV